MKLLYKRKIRYLLMIHLNNNINKCKKIVRNKKNLLKNIVKKTKLNTLNLVKIIIEKRLLWAYIILCFKQKQLIS